MSPIELLGFLGGVFTTASFVPQVVRLFRLKSAQEISLLFSSLLLAGITVWLLYGIFLGLLPVIFWNAISLPLALALLYAKLRYGR